MFKLVESKIPLPSSNCIGTLKIEKPVHVFTEFCPVKSTMIGYMDNSACMPDDFMINDSEPENIAKLKFGTYDSYIIEKCQEI